MNPSAKKVLARVVVIGAVGMATVNTLHAGPLGDGVAVLAQTMQQIASSGATILGPVLTLIGGGRAAWKASHGEAFTTELLSAIVGVAIVAAVAA
jgi:hypothetical protein